MALSTGTRLGPYEILAPIGAGGMGEVYRAKDTRLDRIVAIKVLVSRLSADSERKKRFEREARAISSLSHPHICTLHDIGQHEGTDYLVMEYLEGESMAQRLDKGALPVEQMLRYGIQIAEALDKAHRQGIVHRDLKPGNIMLTKLGAKLLDFGLAKYSEAKTSEAIQAELETRSKPLTEEGMLLGTVQYMAPEQLEGKEVDKRTDIFALGEVLYEMATGQRAFAGQSKASLISAILTYEPKPVSTVVPLAPPSLDHVVKKCLAKDPDDRWQDAGDVAGELKWIVEMGSQPGSAPAAVMGLGRGLKIYPYLALLAVTIGLLMFAGGAAFMRWYQHATGYPRVSSIVPLTRDGLAKDNMTGPTPLLTDGERIYFTEMLGAAPLLAQVSVAGGETVTSPAPFPWTLLTSISNDGSQLLLGGTQFYGGEVPFFVLALPQGTPRRMNIEAGDAVWSRDGRSLAYTKGPALYVANADGSNPKKIAAMPDYPFWPRWSPDGKTICFSVGPAFPAMNSSSLWQVKTDGTQLKKLPGVAKPEPDECCGDWSSDGKYYFFQATENRRTNIWMLPQGSNTPVQLTNGPLNFRSLVPSPDGRKIFVVGEEQLGQLERFDAKLGQFVPYLRNISPDWIEFSRDGQWMVYSELHDGTLWRSHPDGSDRLQLTFAPMQATICRWSPDGKRIAFMGRQPGQTWNIHMISLDGSNLVRLWPATVTQGDPTWSPDGKKIAFDSYAFLGVNQSGPIELLDLANRQLKPIAGSENLFGALWSPDGRYLAGITPDGLNLMIYDFSSGKWNEGVHATMNFFQWAQDSNSLYYDVFSSDPAIYRLQVPTMTSERIVTVQGFRRPFGFIGSFFGLAADGSPLIVADIGTHEIYALNLSTP